MSDLELVSLNLTAEYLSIDSEMQLFIKLPNSLKTNIKGVFTTKENEIFFII